MSRVEMEVEDGGFWDGVGLDVGSNKFSSLSSIQYNLIVIPARGFLQLRRNRIQPPQLETACLLLHGLPVIVLALGEEIRPHDEVVRVFGAEFETARRLVEEDGCQGLWGLYG